MRIRDFEEKDIPKLEQMFKEQPWEYEMPDFSKFIANQVMVNEQDEPMMAIACRPTLELYLLMDKNWETPGMRFAAFQDMHESVRAELYDIRFKRLDKEEVHQFDDVHVWLPPQIEKSFSRRLMRWFGWFKPLWGCYSRLTTPDGKR